MKYDSITVLRMIPGVLGVVRHRSTSRNNNNNNDAVRRPAACCVALREVAAGDDLRRPAEYNDRVVLFGRSPPRQRGDADVAMARYKPPFLVGVFLSSSSAVAQQTEP